MAVVLDVVKVVALLYVGSRVLKGVSELKERPLIKPGDLPGEDESTLQWIERRFEVDLPGRETAEARKARLAREGKEREDAHAADDRYRKEIFDQVEQLGVTEFLRQRWARGFAPDPEKYHPDQWDAPTRTATREGRFGHMAEALLKKWERENPGR